MDGMMQAQIHSIIETKYEGLIQYKIRNTQDHISDYNERSLFPVPCNLHSIPAGDLDGNERQNVSNRN